MPIEWMLAVLVLVMLVDAALVAALSRSERFVVHWAPLRRALTGRPSRPPVGDVPTVRQRPVYVASGAPGRTQADPFAILPPDLAALVTQPAPFSPGPGEERRAWARSRGDGQSSGYPAPGDPDEDSATDRSAAGFWPGWSGVGPGVAPDPLTGLEGPNGWIRILETENARLLRFRHPVTAVVVEIEGLDGLVEWQGEAASARLLPIVARSLRRQVREADWLARIGEGRFGLLLVETDEIQAINFVERVRLTCEPWLAASSVPLRLAIGWASPPASADLALAVRRAEERMHADRRSNVAAREPEARLRQVPGRRRDDA